MPKRTLPKRTRILAIAALTIGLAAPAAAQNRLGRQVINAGGGASSGNGIRHFGATGQGFAVGNQGDDLARHGFLPGNRIRDELPPEFDPEPDDILASTARDQCRAIVNIPAVRVTDNQDNDPDVTVVLQTNPPQNLDPTGDQVTLEIGTYDVLVTATDAAGNQAQTSYRIDVVDGVAPEIRPVPADRRVEASSPAGTVLDIPFQCLDACDPRPVGARDPSIVRYPVGVTEVDVTCEDAVGNVNTQTVRITVVDTTPPTLAGAVDDVSADCDGPNGATIDLPQLVWMDNGTSAQNLDVSLIVDPGAGQTVFADPPERITLRQGRHVLRFTATDASGNTANEDVVVTVNDGGDPIITIVNAPQNGWVNNANVSIVFDVTDGCGAGGANFDVDIAPPPVAQNQNGNRHTITYNAEGVYTLEITATDDGGDETVDTSIAFGIDRTAPEAVVRIPSQVRVADGQQGTYPLFAWAERLALNVGAEDSADGVASGVARVRVVLDPGDDDRVLADVTYPGNGSPRTGDRVVSNIGCQRLDRDNGQVQIRDGYCNRNGAMDLREIPTGVHFVEITATDFAGNEEVGGAYFISADLHEGSIELLRRIGALLGGAPANVRVPLQFAALALGRARDLSELKDAATDYDSPIFMGSALRGSQDATVKLVEALALANGGVRDSILEIVNALQRFSASDVELLQAHTAGENRGNRPPYLTQALATDTRFVAASLATVTQHIQNAAWNQAASAALDGAFFAKSAYSEWMMDYHYSPQPNNTERVQDEFERGRILLDAMIAEMNTYLTLDVKPAENEIRTIRDRLRTVSDRLDLLVREGFDGNGLSDRAYLGALLDLRDVANFSTVASNNGAWVRNYQWTMMQVVRYMTQYSQRDAIFYRGQGRDLWPIYETGLDFVEEGVGLLDERRVQAVIDLYGTNIHSHCLVIAVYHCDFINDEGADDLDPVYPEEDTPSACWDYMYRPSEWDRAPAGNLIPACRYDVDGIR